MVYHELIVTIGSYATVCGILCSSFFLFLLFFTRKSMKIEGFGFALGQNCIIDIIFATGCFFAKYDAVAMKRYSVYSATSADFPVPHYITNIWIILLYLTTNMTFYAIGIPFYVRYLKVCKRQNLSGMRIAFFYIGLLMYEAIVLYFVHRAYKINPKELEELRMKPQFWPNSTGRFWDFAAAELVSFNIDQYEEIWMSICLRFH